MRKIIMLLLCCTFASIGHAQQQRTYPLRADGVVEFGHSVYDDAYYIIYRDTNVFPDLVLELDDSDEYGSFMWYEETYIEVECDRNDFFEYLKWFSDAVEWKGEAFYSADSRYSIKEIVTDVEGGENHRFYLNNLTKCTH